MFSFCYTLKGNISSFPQKCSSMSLNANLSLATISNTIYGQAFWGTGGRSPLQNLGKLWWLNGGHELPILCLSKNLSTADTVAFLSETLWICRSQNRTSPLCTMYKVQQQLFPDGTHILISITDTFSLNVL